MDLGVLLIRQRRVGEPGGAGADRAHTGEHEGTRRRRGLACLGEIRGHRLKLAALGQLADDRGEVAQDLAPEPAQDWREREAAVAVYDGGEALRKLRLTPAGAKERGVGVPVNVDEPGRQVPPPRLYHPRGPGLAELPHSLYPFPGNAHVGGESPGPAAVEHHGVANEQIKHGIAF